MSTPAQYAALVTLKALETQRLVAAARAARRDGRPGHANRLIEQANVAIREHHTAVIDHNASLVSDPATARLALWKGEL